MTKTRRPPTQKTTKKTVRGSKPQSPDLPVTRRRPFRPIDRQKMSLWLKDRLEEGPPMTEQIWWIEEPSGFAVKWKHKARNGYSAQDDASLFRAWAKHTGIFVDGDPEDPRKWKANFRSALHSLRDVQEVTEREERKGNNAVRKYRFLEEPKPGKCKKTKRTKRGEESVKTTLPPATVQGTVSGNNFDPSTTSEVTTLAIPTPVLSPDSLPHFDQLISSSKTTFTASNRDGGGRVIVNDDNTLNQQTPSIPFQGPWSVSGAGGSGAVRSRSPSGDSGTGSYPGHVDEAAEEAFDVQLLSSDGDLDSDEGHESMDEFMEEEFLLLDRLSREPQQTQADWSPELVADWPSLFSAPVPTPVAQREAVIIEQVESAGVDEYATLTCLQNSGFYQPAPTQPAAEADMDFGL